ncbi:MAG: hypothetical protein KF838_00375 [Phycisphaeraceae bacterium]|nr:MAG: hypothetical protein KF838_00375 [Phycisphaeraceae bacterium]
MSDSAFMRHCERGGRAFRRASVFAVEPKATKDGTGWIVKDSGVVYSWELFIATFCVLAFLHTMWLFAPYGGVLSRPWIFVLEATIVASYVAAATYTSAWTVRGTEAVVRRKALGVTFVKQSVSDIRLCQYHAIVLYRKKIAGYTPVTPLRNRGAVLVVLDSSSRFLVLMMSEGEEVESYRGWSGARYSSVLGLPLEHAGVIVVRNAW